MLKMITSADVTPKEFSNWYLFNTWLQNNTQQKIHLDIPISVEDLHQRIEKSDADIVYANPYDTSTLVRDYGFVPVVKADNQTDEVVIVAKNNDAINNFIQLAPNTRIALTDDRDVKMIGMILIEPADLNSDNVEFITADSPIAVAKKVISEAADIGFILTKAYDAFSPLVTDELKTLVRSQISVISHTLMVKPHVFDSVPNLSNILTDMHQTPAGKLVLEGFGINHWLTATKEEVEFMIDLMETLK